MEDGAGANEGDQVWRVDGSLPGLGGVDELVGDGQPSRVRAKPFVRKPTVAKVLSIGLAIRR